MPRHLFCLFFVSLTLSGQDAPRTLPLNRDIRLWKDVPEYAERLRQGKNPRQPPRMLTTVQPVMPPVPLAPGQSVRVRVALVIGEDGKVEAARVFESTDVRFDEAALTAVRQWIFSPALGETGPVKSFADVPIEFAVPPPQQLALQLGPLQRDIRRLSIGMSIKLAGTAAPGVRAGRVTIASAKDDTGADLRQEGVTQEFRRVAVGSVSAEDLRRTPIPDLYFSLANPAAGATRVASVTGMIELVIPAADPDATATFEQLALRIGRPLEAPALAAAGVTLVVFNRASGREGPKAYDAGPMFGDMPGRPPQMAGRFDDELAELDLGFGIGDPEGRLVGFELQAVDGGPLEYNHNGHYHSSGTGGKHFSVFRLRSPLPPDAKLVCWLVTPKSLQKVPLNLTDLPLPP